MDDILIDNIALDSGLGVVRQWISFPPVVCAIRTSRLRSFRLLIESGCGHLMFVALRAKSAPDADMAMRIAGLLGDGNPYVDRTWANAVLDDLGLHAQLLNSPIDSEKAWLPPTMLAETLLDQSLQQGEQFRDIDRAQFEEDLRRQLRAHISLFICNLDKIAVEAARNAEAWLCRPSSYNYLRGRGVADCMLRRNRTQAALAFPFLLPILPLDPWLMRVRKAIDTGTPPLIEVLANSFAVPKSVIRALRNQPGSSIGPQWALQPGVLTLLLSEVPVHLRPQTPEVWEAFNNAVALITKLSGHSIDSTANRLWLRTAAAQGYQVADAVDIELERAARDIDEFRHRLTDALNFRLRTTTGLSNRIGVAAAVRTMITAHNPVKLARVARRWREAYIREQAQFSDERQLWLGACWPAMISEPFETEKRRIICLTTADELTAEGNEMQTCVASYAAPCLQGNSQIWSLRDSAGNRCSTLETVVSEKTLRVGISQHGGPNNALPSTTCLEAAGILLKSIERRKGEVEAYVHWKKSIASRPTDERIMIALYRPILTAFDATLPKQWSIEKLLSIAKSTCDESHVGHSNQNSAGDRSGLSEESAHNFTEELPNAA